MKKDIEWLKKEIKKIHALTFDAYEAAVIANNKHFQMKNSEQLALINKILEILNQLDEPEVLSQEWIDKHKVARINNLRKMTMSDVVPVDELQDLLVPKQELPVLPKYVAEWITNHREKYDLYPALRTLENNTLVWGLIYKWYRTNTHKFVNAYLTGEYKVEEEQKYYVMNEENELILGWSQSAYMTPCIEGYEYMKHNGRENLFQLTEQEIKDYDERYWAFAEPVEQVDFRLSF